MGPTDLCPLYLPGQEKLLQLLSGAWGQAFCSCPDFTKALACAILWNTQWEFLRGWTWAVLPHPAPNPPSFQPHSVPPVVPMLAPQQLGHCPPNPCQLSGDSTALRLLKKHPVLRVLSAGTKDWCLNLEQTPSSSSLPAVGTMGSSPQSEGWFKRRNSTGKFPGLTAVTLNMQSWRGYTCSHHNCLGLLLLPSLVSHFHTAFPCKVEKYPNSLLIPVLALGGQITVKKILKDNFKSSIGCILEDWYSCITVCLIVIYLHEFTKYMWLSHQCS